MPFVVVGESAGTLNPRRELTRRSHLPIRGSLIDPTRLCHAKLWPTFPANSQVQTNLDLEVTNNRRTHFSKLKLSTTTAPPKAV